LELARLVLGDTRLRAGGHLGGGDQRSGEAARRACNLCTDDQERAKSHGDLIADDALLDTVLSRLDDFSRQALNALIDEIFDANWAPKCFGRISTHLRDLNGNR